MDDEYKYKRLEAKTAKTAKTDQLQDRIINSVNEHRCHKSDSMEGPALFL